MKHFYKLLSLLLCCCLLLTALPFAALAQEPEGPEFSFFYDVIDHERKFIVVYGLDGPVTGGVLTVPAKINGYTVKEIGWNAFRDRPGLREVVLPDTVAYIGGSAFENCEKLKTVKLPAELEEIDSAAFARCPSLEEIELPEGVRRLADHVFDDCVSLKTVKLSAGLEAIQDCAFLNCAALQEIDLPEHLNELGSSAFESCTSLTRAVVPGSVVTVPDYAFWGCAALEDLTLCEGIENIWTGAFEGCAALKELTLPGTIRGINKDAFSDCAALEALHVPAHLEFLDPEAFINCTSLAAVTADPANPFLIAENNVLYSGDKGAMILYPAGKPETSFTLPDETYSIEGRFAFYGSPLTELNINHAGYIAPGAVSISGISKLTKAKDNNDFVIIDNVLYNDCGEFLLGYPGGLTAEIFTVPEKVWNIEANAFRNNQHLKKVVLPEGVTQIMSRAFQNSVVEDVNIPSTVSLLDEGIFIDCANLKAAAVPEGVTVLPYATFAGCYSLETVTLPQSLLEIGDFAFEDCKVMKIPALPDGLKSIGQRAFLGCRQMRNLKLPASVSFIDYGAFASTPWFDALPDGPVYLNNVLYTYKGEVPEDTSFTVKEGTVMITAEAFGWQWGLTQLTVPDSVEIVGGDAFSGTRWYDEMLPEGDVYIGKAFYNHKGPSYEGKTLTLKEGTVSVTPGAFWNMDRVETLTIPASLVMLREWDRFDLRSLKEYRVAEDNTIFAAADGVLYAKDGKTLLSYPPKKADKAYTIPYGTEYIAARAFRDNEHLETLTVPASLRNSVEAMENCPALKDVYYGGVRRMWDEFAGSGFLLQNGAQLHITHEDVFKHTGSEIIVTAGARVGDVMFTISNGAGLPVSRPDGTPVTPEDEVCSGMIITMPVDGKESQQEPIIVLGDVDGDGQITSADARLALRFSVKLDNPARWQLSASRVTGGEKTISEDARLILRASVRLENAFDWFRAYIVK